MSEPTLRKTTALSFIIHLTVFLIALLVLKQTNHIIVPSPYVVSLVNPGYQAVSKVKDMGIQNDTGISVKKLEEIPQKSSKEKVMERKMIEEKISALQAKKKIEKIVNLRQVISLRANSGKQKGDQLAIAQSNVTPFNDYYSKITKEIWEQWIFPDVGNKNIEAIISIRILKDGTAIVQKVEKSSGNALFDRSAIKALARASPLSPPPYEMEIGVRFYP